MNSFCYNSEWATGNRHLLRDLIRVFLCITRWPYHPHGVQTLMSNVCTVLLLGSVVLVSACSRQPHSRQSSCSTVVTNVPACSAAPLLSITLDKSVLDTIRSNTSRYAGLLSRYSVLTLCLEDVTWGDLSLEEMSNRVANVPTALIMDTIAPLEPELNRKNPHTRAIMRLYEVIVARGQPKSAEFFARVQLARYYTLCFWDRYDETIQFLKQAELSGNPTEAEKINFATVQDTLVRCYMAVNPEEAIRHMDRVREMVARGVFPFGQQPLDMYEMYKADCLIDLGRIEEARAHLTDVYERVKKGQLDSSLRSSFHHFYYKDIQPGVEGYIQNHLRHNADVTPYPRESYDL